MAQQVRAPLSVYMLADHLDAALAAGEDLMARGGDWRALAETPADPSDFILQQRAGCGRGSQLRTHARRPHPEGPQPRQLARRMR